MSWFLSTRAGEDACGPSTTVLSLSEMHVIDRHLACLNTAHHLSQVRILYFQRVPNK
jgi:hypothetical protein